MRGPTASGSPQHMHGFSDGFDLDGGPSLESFVSLSPDELPQFNGQQLEVDNVLKYQVFVDDDTAGRPASDQCLASVKAAIDADACAMSTKSAHLWHVEPLQLESVREVGVEGVGLRVV